MGRNKLSDLDRIKNQFERAKKIIKCVEEGNSDLLFKNIKKVRSKTLRDLCYLMLYSIDDINFLTRHPKIISKKMGWSERKVYDLILTLRILEEASDTGFQKLNKKFLKKQNENPCDTL